MGNICAEPLREDPTPDPESGLTQREKRLLKELWLVLTEHSTLKEEGVRFANKLQEKFPLMIEYYPFCLLNKDIRGAECIGLRAHGIGVMFGMTAYIECLDDPFTIESLIKKLATSHSRYGVTVEEMEKLIDVLFEFIQDECQHGVKKDSFDALKKLLTFHNKVFRQAMETLILPDSEEH